MPLVEDSLYTCASPCEPCRGKGAGFGPDGKGGRSVEGDDREKPASNLHKAGRCDTKAGEDLLLYRQLHRYEREIARLLSENSVLLEYKEKAHRELCRVRDEQKTIGKIKVNTEI